MNSEDSISHSIRWNASPINILILLLAGACPVIGGCFGCRQATSYIVWSEGYRDGHVIKFSYKSFPVKHYEGDLNMGALGRNNSTASHFDENSLIWHFSVNDPEIVEQVEAIDAEVPVRLHYKEYMSPGLWNDTAYVVNKVERLNNRR